MKNCILFLALGFTLNAMAIITSPMSNQFNAAGTQTNSDKIDIMVKCAETAAAGDVVTFSLSEDDGATVELGDVIGEASACVMVKSCTAGQLKPCRVWGYISANFDASQGTSTAGVPVFVSASVEGKLRAISSPSGHNYPIGIALDTLASTGALEIFVKQL